MSRDLPGTGSKPVHAECLAQPGRLILLPLRARSSECGPETSHAPTVRRESAARGMPPDHDLGFIEPLLLPAGRRSVACPAIWREPAVKPVHAECLAQPGRLILLPLRARSSECGPEQARSYSIGVVLSSLKRRGPCGRGPRVRGYEGTRVWAAIRTNAVGQSRLRVLTQRIRQ